MSSKSQRNLNIDLIKILAVISVIGIHFMGKTGFYEHAYDSPLIFVASLTYSILTTCVPLFLIASGFLMKSKSYNKKYFLSLLKIIGIYVGAAAIYNFVEVRNLDFNFFSRLIKNIFIFSHYSWYVNMYIGLYLIAPLINAGFSGLSGRRQKLTAVALISVLTVLPATFKFIGAARGITWLGYLVPDFWANLWPICYFLVGSFLAEFGSLPDLKKRKIAIFSPIFSVLAAVLFFYLVQSSRTAFVAWAIAPVFVVSISVFISLINLKIKIRSEMIRSAIIFISNNTLSIYLLSVIGDTYIYPLLASRWTNFKQIFPLFPLVVAGLFMLSLAITAAYRIVIYTGAKLLKIFSQKIRPV